VACFEEILGQSAGDLWIVGPYIWSRKLPVAPGRQNVDLRDPGAIS
jgi:hypothetical protein